MSHTSGVPRISPLRRMGKPAMSVPSLSNAYRFASSPPMSTSFCPSPSMSATMGEDSDAAAVYE
jgi:hypothetical protein